MTKAANVAGVLMAILSAASCRSPTDPCEDPFGRGDNLANLILVSCDASGSNLQCTARPTYGLYDKCPQPLGVISWVSSSPSIASVSSSGVVTVLARGEVDITVKSGSVSSEVWSALVDPQESPRRLSSLSGFVRENNGSDATLSGATVEILDGYNAGASDESSTTGFYLIERVLTDVTMTVRATRPGYISSTTSFLPNGSGRLDFRLSRATP
jgi:hypothetical protein